MPPPTTPAAEATSVVASAARLEYFVSSQPAPPNQARNAEMTLRLNGET